MKLHFRHIFVDGFGGMGDALTCCECGICKYPEVFSFATMALSTIIREDHPQYREYFDKAVAARAAREAREIQT